MKAKKLNEKQRIVMEHIHDCVRNKTPFGSNTPVSRQLKMAPTTLSYALTQLVDLELISIEAIRHYRSITILETGEVTRYSDDVFIACNGEPLSPHQATIYDYLVKIADEGKPCPTDEELASTLRLNPKSISQFIGVLEHRGYILRVKNRGQRLIKIVATGKTIAPSERVFSESTEIYHAAHYRGGILMLIDGGASTRTALTMIARESRLSEALNGLKANCYIEARFDGPSIIYSLTSRGTAYLDSFTPNYRGLCLNACTRANTIRQEPNPLYIDRTPCPKCGVRGDIGCNHKPIGVDARPLTVAVM